MSHFAKIENGVVTQVIVATQEEINSERHGDAFLWIQCSYNNNFRGTYPCIGYTYDILKDVFISKKPYPSWILGEDNVWYPPSPSPVLEEGDTSISWTWNEEAQTWDSYIVEKN
jgi:hypothetical protein